MYKPVTVEIEISHHCNLRCSGCAILDDIKNAKYIFSEKSLLGFLHQADGCGIESYALTGGEPFLNFALVMRVINKSPIDLHKINTNGFLFYSPDKAGDILVKLKDAGFSSRRKKIKPWLNISIGQQNSSGIPLENAVFAARAFFNLFASHEAGFSLNVFSKNEEFEYYIIKKFLRKYNDITGKDYNQRQYPIKIIPADCHGNSSVSKFHVRRRNLTIKNLIDYYLDEEKTVLHCLQNENLKRTYLVPRMLLRADGTIYSCAGFSHVHNLGNINNDSLESILTRANENNIIRTVFQSSLRGLLEMAEKYQPGIGSEKISFSNGPCDICRKLRDVVASRQYKY